jgi:hypothetical protein
VEGAVEQVRLRMAKGAVLMCVCVCVCNVHVS